MGQPAKTVTATFQLSLTAQTLHILVRLRLGELRDFRCDARLYRSRTSLIVNHIGYFTVIAQGNRDHVVESDSGFLWNFYRSAEHDLRLDKDTVDA